MSNLWRFDGGFAPQGVLPLILVIQGVIFAYATIELVGTASGETQNPRKVIPKAVHAVVFRLVVFYLGPWPCWPCCCRIRNTPPMNRPSLRHSRPWEWDG
ncbi:L-asparagine permease [Cutibacterium acnes JCM 18918]|nr:L-asparagine permease [Cutibacterium acnes JCM 18918]